MDVTERTGLLRVAVLAATERTVDFLATTFRVVVVFFTAGFLTADFLTEVALTVGFLTTVLRVVDLATVLRPDLRADVLVAVERAAVDFLAIVFPTADFLTLEAAFFTAGLRTALETVFLVLRFFCTPNIFIPLIR